MEDLVSTWFWIILLGCISLELLFIVMSSIFIYAMYEIWRDGGGYNDWIDMDPG